MATKSILFKVALQGHGIVNYDSNDQKWAWNAMVRNSERVNHENVQFGKHRYYLRDKDEKGEIYDRHLVISADCLRHNIFIDDFLFQSPNVFAHPVLFNKMIASVGALLRGYMFAQEGKSALRKKSCLNITEAEQTNDAISTIETFSRSGHREVREDENDTADNSFFKRESIGEITYAAKGSVDLKELQFVSLSELYDRMAVNSDDFTTLYKPELEKALGPIHDPGYYVIKNSAVQTPEYGFILSGSQIVFLVKELFKRLLRLSINKSSGGYAEVAEVQIKYVEDPLKHRMNIDADWIPLSDEEQIQFDPDIFYERMDDETARSYTKLIEKNLADSKKRSKERKIEQKAERNARKNAARAVLEQK